MPEGRMTRPTIYDVAKKAGISITTVSNVIHDKENIPKSTKKRVRKIMKSLNYIPNIVAQRLVTKKSNIISLLIPAINNPFFAELYNGIERYITEHELGYRMLIGNTLYSASRESELIRAFREEYVDGFIIVSNNPKDSEIKRLKNDGIPFVFSVNDTKSVPKDPLVTYNNYDVSYQATKYLLDLRHSRFGYIAGLFEESDRAQARFNGFHDALRESGIRFNKKNLIVGGSYSAEAGYKACMKLFSSQRSMPTALFCANDLIAIGAMRAIRERGLNVPEDISIVGFDNIQPSAYISPPLTTIDLNISGVGYKSAELLFTAIDGEKTTENRAVISGKLIIRESCAQKR